jgi:hypothetical protein
MNITNVDKKHSVRYKEDNFHILVLYSFVKNRSFRYRGFVIKRIRCIEKIIHVKVL